MNRLAVARFAGSTTRLLIGAAIGILAAVLGILSTELTPRALILVCGCLLVLGIAALAPRPRPVLLFGWIVALTYGKASFPFLDDSKTDFMGLYFILSDVFLVALLLHWLIVPRRQSSPRWGPSKAWPWFLPFVAACVIATFTANKVDWAAVELYRLGKLLLVMIFLGSTLDVEEWWACVAGLGFATIGQAALSVLQVALGKTSAGIIGGLVGAGESAEAAAQASAMQGAMGGWFRAYGTIGHPANLATYFLITIPVLLGVSFALKGKWQFWGIVSAICGMAGLACTQSRGPWMFGAAQIALVLIGLVLFRILAPNRAIILVGVCAVVSIVLGIHFQQFIADRWSRDYDESVELRERDTHTAYMIFSEHPYVGVGLNNYATRILDYDPQFDWAMSGAAEFQKEFDSRVFVAPHNFYMFVLAETGIVGMLGFALWIAGLVWIGMRGVWATQGAVRMVCFGFLLGLVGVLAQSAISFSLWVDPILFTIGLVAVLLVAAPPPAEPAHAHA